MAKQELSAEQVKEIMETLLEERYRLQEQRFHALEQSVLREDERFANLLSGFPQLYATKLELDQVRGTADTIRSDFVPREAFEDLKSKVDESGGRRTTLVAASGVIVTVFILLLSLLITTIPSSDEITAQIKVQAPWVSDRPGVLATIQRQSATIAKQNAEILQMKSRVAFLCRTRVPQLPPC